jgi:hypothetical protein
VQIAQPSDVSNRDVLYRNPCIRSKEDKRKIPGFPKIDSNIYTYLTGNRKEEDSAHTHASAKKMKLTICNMFQMNKQRRFEGAGLKSSCLKKDMTLCVIHTLIQGSSSSTIIRVQGGNEKLEDLHTLIQGSKSITIIGVQGGNVKLEDIQLAKGLT